MSSSPKGIKEDNLGFCWDIHLRLLSRAVARVDDEKHEDKENVLDRRTFDISDTYE